MRQHIKGHYKNRATRRAYKKHARYFWTFVKERGYTANQVRENPQLFLQAYADQLVADKKSANTIHTYLSFPCTFFGVPMSDIKKPPRTTAGITKSRGKGNAQGKREENLEKNARVVAFEKDAGVRRAEVKRLDGCNFKQDESGYWCVEVIKGKGGKYHLQRILPDDVEFVRSYFDGTEQKLFSRDEMNNKIDFHAMRSAKARRAYDYYVELLRDPAQRSKLLQELADRYCLYNVNYLKNNRDPKILAAFMRDCQGTYKLRGDTVTLAKSKDRPVVYDRTAVMAVSVFHLSHWRCGVAVRNYLLA